MARQTNYKHFQVTDTENKSRHATGEQRADSPARHRGAARRRPHPPIIESCHVASQQHGGCTFARAPWQHKGAGGGGGSRVNRLLTSRHHAAAGSCRATTFCQKFSYRCEPVDMPPPLPRRGVPARARGGCRDAGVANDGAVPLNTATVPQAGLPLALGCPSAVQGRPRMGIVRIRYSA